MKKGIIVKKRKSYRVFLATFSIVAIGIMVITVVCMNDLIALLMCLPVFLILVPFVLYYNTWLLRFEEQHILYKAFLRKMKKYSYAQLQEVKQRYYISENNFCIHMRFSDGKSVKFRMDDDGASSAIKAIQRHCSIKTVSVKSNGGL